MMYKKRSNNGVLKTFSCVRISVFVWLFTCFWSFEVECNGYNDVGLQTRTPTKRRSAKVDGDVIIGALFPVHRQPSITGAFTRQCGEIWEQYGIQRIEVLLRTLDEINANPSLLPGIKLGCDVRDTCWYAPIALEQSIDFIRNSIASVEASTSTDTFSTTATTLGSHRGAGGVNELADVACGSAQKTLDKPIAGLIGPASSTVTMQIQNLLALFNIPQIGYSATAVELSKKSSYPYFVRVVPSDLKQARVLADVVRYFGWNYISTVYTSG